MQVCRDDQEAAVGAFELHALEVVGDFAAGEGDEDVHGHEVVFEFCGCVEEVVAGGERGADGEAVFGEEGVVGPDEDEVVGFEDLDGFGVDLVVAAEDGGVEFVGGGGEAAE